MTLSSEISNQEQFSGNFKEVYRVSTIGVYEKIVKMFGNGNRYFYLAVLVALCHGYNRIVEASEEELHEIFNPVMDAKQKTTKIIDFS